ncbi:hypothetical protein SARC_14036, partial [Sphaeroforma arctica JP610]
EDKRKAYVKHVAKIFQLAGFDNVDEAAQQVMDVELGLAKVSKTNTERRDVQAYVLAASLISCLRLLRRMRPKAC